MSIEIMGLPFFEENQDMYSITHDGVHISECDVFYEIMDGKIIETQFLHCFPFFAKRENAQKLLNQRNKKQ